MRCGWRQGGEISAEVVVRAGVDRVAVGEVVTTGAVGSSSSSLSITSISNPVISAAALFLETVMEGKADEDEGLPRQLCLLK